MVITRDSENVHSERFPGRVEAGSVTSRRPGRAAFAMGKITAEQARGDSDWSDEQEIRAYQGKPDLVVRNGTRESKPAFPDPDR